MHRKRKPARVFCIGFHKTGTTSLAVALETLGYRVTGPNGTYDPAIARHVNDMAVSLAERYDAFRDNPWPVLYKDMDKRYPGSRFILTIREPDAWIGSLVRHFGRKESPMRQWIYGAGCPQGNESIYLERYRRHNEDVLAYFKNRPADLLVMELSRGDGWEKLCPFLAEPDPGVPFPHSNEARDRESRYGLKARFIRSSLKAYYRLKSRIR